MPVFWFSMGGGCCPVRFWVFAHTLGEKGVGFFFGVSQMISLGRGRAGLCLTLDLSDRGLVRLNKHF